MHFQQQTHGRKVFVRAIGRDFNQKLVETGIHK